MITMDYIIKNLIITGIVLTGVLTSVGCSKDCFKQQTGNPINYTPLPMQPREFSPNQYESK